MSRPLGAYIGLGSNLNHPRRQLRSALAALATLPHSRVLGSSRLYRSPPLGPPGQPDYLNGVALLETYLPPLALLEQLQRIEQEHQRVRGVRWGARTLDLDLLLYGEQRLHTPRLTLPHPAIGERPFVLLPLCELAGSELPIPGVGASGALLAALAKLPREAPNHPENCIPDEEDHPTDTD